jgi:hypothetical protein
MEAGQITRTKEEALVVRSMHSTPDIAVYHLSMFPEVPVLTSCYSSSIENTVPIKIFLHPQPQQRHKKIKKKKDNTKKKDASDFSF